MKSPIKAILCALLLTAASQPARADMKAALAALDASEYEKSAKMLAEAFEAGEYDAAFYMGRMLELGLAGNADPAGAVALYAAGSAKGSALSKNRLGILHMEGAGVLQDFAQGAKLICEAADAGEDNALYNCGALYLEGKGMAPDAGKALAYFEKAAARNNVAARNALADALSQGTDIAADPARAFELWQQTAAVGNPYGLYRLARSYAEGSGTARDAVKAHAYANLAAARGFPGASQLRAEIEAGLPAGDIVAAQQMARGWRAQEPQAGEPAATASPAAGNTDKQGRPSARNRKN